MFQQATTRPASNPAPATDEARGKRRYRKHPPEELAAMRLDVHRGAKVSEVAAKYDVASSIVYKAVAANPRPKQEPGESKSLYGIRVREWMREIDPEYRERYRANKSRALRLSARRRKREALKAEAAASAQIPPPVNVEAIQPVAAKEPPWGFAELTAPAETHTRPPGFWRSVGMMLGLVR